VGAASDCRSHDQQRAGRDLCGFTTPLTIDSSAIVSIALFLAIQTGSLIYFAGRTTARLENLEKRSDNLEEDRRDCEIRRWGGRQADERS